MANVIYRGPVLREPITKTAQVTGALLPGSVVNLKAGKFSAAADAKGRIFILNVRDFTGQLPTQAYADGDTAAAFRLEPEQEYQVQAAVGDYTEGDALTVKAGVFTRTLTTGDIVVAVVERTKSVKAGDLLLDIAIVANTYAHA